MKFEAIKACEADFDISVMCEVFNVSRSGYYAWLNRDASAHSKQDAELTVRIKAISQANRGVYGSPRIYAELKAQGVKTSRKRVARLMKAAGIVVKPFKPIVPRTTQVDHTHRFAPNHLDRDFTATRPNEKWVADITYVATREGWLYVAAVEDLFSRQIVGLTMAEAMPTHLVETAFHMAWQHRQPDPGLLHHSDRGSQYTSNTFQELLGGLKITISMSRTGECLDNAPIESFWSTLKRECANQVFDTREQARVAIFDYVMVFYNRTRRHSALGYISPEQFENQFYETTFLSTKVGH